MAASISPAQRTLLNRATIRPPAELSPSPRSLHELWTEYLYGVGGRKPAKDFNREERGRVKHKYCRRNKVWRVIDNLVKAGYHYEDAIQRIYGVYGHSTPVTTIINKLGEDLRNNRLSPMLRV